MYKIFGVLLLFFYLFPVFFNFMPLPTDRILQLVGIILLIAVSVRRKQIAIDRRILKVILLSLGMTFLSVLALFNTNEPDFYVAKYMFDICLLTFSSFLIVYFFKKFDNEFNIVKLLDYIIVANLIQALVSFIFFLNPSLYTTFTSYLNADTNQALFTRLGAINKRLLGVGNSFFTAVTNYGFALLILTVLPFLKDSFIARYNTIYRLSVSIVCIAGVLSGRFFFVAIGLAFFFLFVVEKGRILQLMFKFVKILFLGLGGLVLLSMLFQNLLDTERLVVITEWAFEFVINYSQSGELTTSSSQATLDMYMFPDNINTWLTGDGKFVEQGGSYYKGTDVGYLRLIYYFGAFSTAAYFLTQYSYAKVLTIKYGNRALNIFCYFLFVWIVLLNFKGISNGDSYFILFLVCICTKEGTIKKSFIS